MAVETKKVEISFVYRDMESVHPGVITIVDGFNSMLANLPSEIRYHIDDIKLNIEDLDADVKTDGKLDPL